MRGKEVDGEGGEEGEGEREGGERPPPAAPARDALRLQGYANWMAERSVAKKMYVVLQARWQGPSPALGNLQYANWVPEWSVAKTMHVVLPARWQAPRRRWATCATPTGWWSGPWRRR